MLDELPFLTELLSDLNIEVYLISDQLKQRMQIIIMLSKEMHQPIWL